MSQSMQVFLKPTYYVPEEDKQLTTSVQMISMHKQAGGLKGHALAIAQAVSSIARAIFINIPYYILAGHYKAAMQSVVYAAMATVYTILGTFIPLILSGFKMDVLPENVGIEKIFKDLQEGTPRYFTNDAMVEENWKLYQKKDQAHLTDQEHLFKQVDIDLPRSNVCIDGIRYRDAKSVFAHLTKTGKMDEEIALKVMAQIEQGVFVAPFKGLSDFFTRHELALYVLDYAKDIVINVETTKDSVEIEAQNHFCCKITNSESPYYRESPIAIFDTRVLLAIPKDGSACTGHWTWEEIPVEV